MPTVIRVFPRKTKATPDDSLVRVNKGPGLLDKADEIHISVSFTWDLPRAEELAKQWECVAPVKIGGPATGQRSGEFVPGKYLRKGLTITSRGCPNKCWHCSVWRREGSTVREMTIREGHNVQDDNLLGCSPDHIRAVFSMLRKQSEKIEFGGGLQASLLKEWHIEELCSLNLRSVFFAYDTPEDLEPLQVVGERLASVGLISVASMICRCYVLVGFPKDSFGTADQRLCETMEAGFVPYVMVYRGEKDGAIRSPAWVDFKRRWRGNSSVIRSICMEKRKPLLKRIGRSKC